MKKPLRLLLVALGGLGLLLVAAVVVAFNSGFQTWAARRALAAQPSLHARLGKVSAGLGRIELRDLRVEQSGAVLTLPALDADLPLVSAAGKKITLTRLVAKGWILDLSKTSLVATTASVWTHLLDVFAAVPRAPHFSLLPSAYAADPAAQIFRGVFSQLQLPVDLALDGVQLEGDIVLPAGRGRAHVTLTGGGLAAAHEGKFDLVASVTLAAIDAPVSALNVRVILAAAMDTPRTFTRLAVNSAADATGGQFPAGVKLSADLSAQRAAAGETYTVAITAAGKKLFSAAATFPAGTARLAGTWQLDARDLDVAPFALGRPLPTFEAKGQGTFDADAAFTDLRAIGQLTATAEKLLALDPALAAVSPLKLAADFDLTSRGGTFRVEHLDATIAGAAPVLAVRALQPFEFTPKTGDLKAADPAKELVLLSLQGVPLAWAQPFYAAQKLAVTGGDLRGEFAATARDGGFALRSRAPLTATGLSVTQDGNPLLRAVDLEIAATADYTPQGWQAGLAPLTARSGGATLLTLDAKAGQLAGKDQPIKSAGTLAAKLPALLAQPFAGGVAALTAGHARAEFSAVLAATRQFQLKLALTSLVADPKITAEKLPVITADIRADLDAAGKITLNAPLLFERAGRKSDLTVSGTLVPSPAGLVLDARLTSENLVVEDVQILAAPLASSPAAPVASAPAGRDTKPVWAGVSGTVALALKKVTALGKYELSDIGGTVRLDAGALKLDGLRAGLPGGGDAKLGGGVTFTPAAPQPYALTADLAVENFDSAPLFRALDPAKLPTIEARINVASRVTGSGENLAALAAGARGDMQVTSKGGLFRALSADVASKIQKTQSTAAALGGLLGAVTGRSELGDYAAKSQAISDIAKALAEIPFDQLSVHAERDASLNLLLKDFTLISPEVRLGGAGQVTYAAAVPLLEQRLAITLSLGARGKLGELMAKAKLLAAEKDSLGYTAFTVPVKIGGTLAKTDTGDLQRALLSAALEKSGAADALQKLFGGGK